MHNVVPFAGYNKCTGVIAKFVQKKQEMFDKCMLQNIETETKPTCTVIRNIYNNVCISIAWSVSFPHYKLVKCTH